MAVTSASEVSICNLALQKLGATRIGNLTDNTRNARSCNNCYAQLRDKELRAHPWNFSIQRATLAASATKPAFGYLYAFPLPNGFLRLLLPNRFQLDWKLESQSGVRVIMTNDGPEINIRYVAQITDPNQFDPMFIEALACKMAWHMCEEITQSNEKKKDAAGEYKQTMAEARSADAFESTGETSPPESWFEAQLIGSRYLPQ